MPHLVNGRLVAVFNDTSEPDYVKQNQCIAYLRVCPTCGAPFQVDADVCQFCGTKRPRCQKTAMHGEEYCRTHVTTRPYSIYSKLAGTVSDSVLEEMLETEDRTLDQEYALAKLVLAEAVEHRSDMTPKEAMQLCKEFFTIAEKKNNIEKGQVLNVSWNDDLANTMRQKVKQLIKVFMSLIKEYVPVDKRAECIQRLKDDTRFVGNAFSAPTPDSDYVDPHAGATVIPLSFKKP